MILLNIGKELSLLIRLPQLFFLPYDSFYKLGRERESSYSRSPCQESLEEEREKEHELEDQLVKWKLNPLLNQTK